MSVGLSTPWRIVTIVEGSDEAQSTDQPEGMRWWSLVVPALCEFHMTGLSRVGGFVRHTPTPSTK